MIAHPSPKPPKYDEQSPTDLELIEQARDGNQEAFGLLYKRYYKPLLALADRWTGDRELAEEIVQEAFVRTWKWLDRICEKEADFRFKAWVHRVVQNLARDALRRRKAMPPPVELFEEAAAHRDDHTPVELRQDLQRAIKTLGRDDLELLKMREVDHLTYAEIASALGLTQSAAVSRSFRLRARLRKAL